MSKNISSTTLCPNFSIKRFYKGCPNEVLQLRREIYLNEMNFLDEHNLISENDSYGVHICIFDNLSGKLIAAAHALRAEESDFSQHSRVSKESLGRSIYGSRHLIAKEFRGQGIFSLLLYLTMREGRMLGRTSLLAYQNIGEIAVNKIIQMKPLKYVDKRTVQGNDGYSYHVIPCGQDIAYGMYLAWQKMPQAIQNLVASSLLAEEVELTVASRLETFYENPWFKAVGNKTLTKNQYIEMLGDWHNFVRWTTRLLARVVGITENKELRANYLSHLNGEVDHEIMIENDIKTLGGDVEYTRHFMAPGKPIQLFMGLQESIASFRQDPLLFLAVPYSIEGISANISAEVVRNLVACAKSWGIDNPRRACSFISSHVHTDGGADGHWVHSLHMIRKFLRTEPELQKFLTISHLVFDTIWDSFGNAVSKPDYQELVPTIACQLDSAAWTQPRQNSSFPGAISV